MVSPIDTDKYVHNKLLDDKKLTILCNQLKSRPDEKIATASTLIRNLYFNRTSVWEKISKFIDAYVEIIPRIRDAKMMLNHLKNIKDFYVDQNNDYQDSFAILVDAGFKLLFLPSAYEQKN